MVRAMRNENFFTPHPHEDKLPELKLSKDFTTFGVNYYDRDAADDIDYSKLNFILDRGKVKFDGRKSEESKVLLKELNDALAKNEQKRNELLRQKRIEFIEQYKSKVEGGDKINIENDEDFDENLSQNVDRLYRMLRWSKEIDVVYNTMHFSCADVDKERKELEHLYDDRFHYEFSIHWQNARYYPDPRSSSFSDWKKKNLLNIKL